MIRYFRASKNYITLAEKRELALEKARTIPEEFTEID
jgi:hypothetical protein